MEQTGKLRKQNGTLLLLALLCLVLSVFAWRQAPQRNPHIAPALWDERDYWLQPVQRYPHLRLPSVPPIASSLARAAAHQCINGGRFDCCPPN